MNRYKITMVGLLALTVALVFVIQNNWQQRLLLSKHHYLQAGQSATMRDTAKLGSAIRSIYENIRTLSMLPGVRSIDRHGSLSDEGQQTFLQIYNNLASNVDVSEIYVVPIDLNPTKIDLVTLKPEQPILMFDQAITAGHPEASPGMDNHFGVPARVRGTPGLNLLQEESFEYRLMADQAAWLKASYPETSSINGLDVPFISGPEVITCDNRRFAFSGKDADRAGVVFSVPFYGEDGKIKGMISAIILSKALQDLLPSETMALVNPGNGYVNAGVGVQQMKESATSIAQGKVDPNLIYSQVIPFPVKDARSPWYVWSGLPDSEFYNSKDILANNKIRFTGLLILLISVTATGICISLLSRYAAQAQALAVSMRQARDAAQKSESEAQASTEMLQMLNSDITRLNGELAQRLKQLSEAQEDIVKKGKLSQLGNLVATVAHELRNPLGSLRTTVFMLERKLRGSPIDVSNQLQRIEQGIQRCDMIITQLLDFSRSQPANTAEVEVVAWLQTLLQEEAARLPGTITLKYMVSDDSVVAAIDSERMRRGVINLISNAAEAMTSGEGPAKMKEPPVITVSLREAHGSVEIMVSDNGPGIAANILSKVGEPLFTTKSFGTGLGVAAVRKMAELHGGGLNVKSQAGAGASFTIWIPQIRAVEQQA